MGSKNSSSPAFFGHNIHYAKWAVLTLLCVLMAYYCPPLHRKRTGQ